MGGVMNRLLKSFLTALILAASFGLTGTAHAALTASLEQISPNPTVYTSNIDFTGPSDDFSVAGDVTGLLQAVDPGSLDDGCSAADFAGFVPGNIALVRRGSCFFSIKTNNAAAAGAIGILVFNSSPGIVFTQMAGPTGIPFLLISGDLGNAFLAQLSQGEDVVVHMNVVPEPSTFALIAVVLLSMFGFGVMRRRAEA